MCAGCVSRYTAAMATSQHASNADAAIVEGMLFAAVANALPDGRHLAKFEVGHSPTSDHPVFLLQALHLTINVRTKTWLAPPAVPMAMFACGTEPPFEIISPNYLAGVETVA